jgi:hypothetical protein
MPNGGLLAGLPRELCAEGPEDGLVLLEAEVDHVQQDGLAGREVDDRRDEGVVARDHVDLARRGARAGRDGWRAGRRARVAGGREHRDGDQCDGCAA